MNFIETFKEGQQGRNMGLPTGIPPLTEAMRGVRRKFMYGIAAAQKVGKTTFADFSFVLHPYLYMEKEGKLDDIEFIYFSFEIDRISKEYKYAAFFFAHDYGIYNFKYKDAIYSIDSDYLTGNLLHRLPDNSFEVIPVSEDHHNILKEIYAKRIIPLFGEYNIRGEQMKEGKIKFIEDPENPTGVDKYLWDYAKKNGEIIIEKYEVAGEIKERKIGYKANRPDKWVIIITDHIRKLPTERGFTMKQNIDKLLEYHTILKNICHFTFVEISHSNRNVSSIDRLKFAGDWIFPTAEDVKDSGNLPEECNVLLTMFNPNDEKYMLNKHMGLEIGRDGERLFPDYRSIHIAEFRGGSSPTHFRTKMLGAVNMFLPLT